jgi:hypothetical protein
MVKRTRLNISLSVRYSSILCITTAYLTQNYWISVQKTCSLVLFKETLTVCCKSRTEHAITRCGRDARLLWLFRRAVSCTGIFISSGAVRRAAICHVSVCYVKAGNCTETLCSTYGHPHLCTSFCALYRWHLTPGTYPEGGWAVPNKN